MGIYDRDYYRKDTGPGFGLGDVLFAPALLLAHLILSLTVFFGPPRIDQWNQGLAVQDAALFRDGELWRLFTHIFLHADWIFGPFWGFAIAVAVLWRFGSDYERQGGPLRLACLYFGAGIAAAFAWCLLPHGVRGESFAGPAAPLLALAALATYQNPNQPISIAGVLTTSNRWVLVVLTLITLLPLADISAWRAGIFPLACLANTIGLLAPWAPFALAPDFAKQPARASRRRRPPSVAVNVKTARNAPSEVTPLSMRADGASSKSDGKSPLDEDQTFDQRLDEILGKINQSGQASLTEQEREFLQHASQKLNQRRRT